MYSEILSVSIIYEFKLDNQETFVFFYNIKIYDKIKNYL